jgi:hypothetical protein
MKFWRRLFGKHEAQSSNEMSDLPTYWQWIGGSNPIEQFAAIGSIEMVFREHPEAIGGPEHKRTVELLNGVLNGASKALQAEAITVLALIKAADALPQIIQKTEDPDPNVREKAMRARDELSHYLETNTKDEHGNIPLILAASGGDTSSVKALILAGADVNAKNEEGGTALMRAAHGRDREILKALIAAGANVNAKNVYGWTALMFAVSEGLLDNVNTLIAAHADVNAKTSNDSTALATAVLNGDAACVKALITAGADVNKRAYNGANEALVVAKSHPDVVAILRAAGARE